MNNIKYPAIVADYERSFSTLQQLRCDVLLAPHPEFFHLHEKHALQLHSGNSDAFIDRQELQRFNAESRLDFEHELQRQENNANKGH